MTSPKSPNPKSGLSPLERLRRILSAAPREEETPSQPAARPAAPPYAPLPRLNTRLWNFASGLSLAFNGITLLIVIGLGFLMLLNGISLKALVAGLYDNFVLMDNAVIQAEVPVQADVPVSFPLQLRIETEVVLTRDVQLSDVPVLLNTAVLDINAPADITLRAGTRLPILLDLTVPVQTTIPISLTIPVSIPIAATGLHPPFVNLQETIKPIHCALSRGALDPYGMPVCDP